MGCIVHPVLNRTGPLMPNLSATPDNITKYYSPTYDLILPHFK
jgi:hypothetical protein